MIRRVHRYRHWIGGTCLGVAATAVAWAVVAAIAPVDVYGAPRDFEIRRVRDDEGRDRIYVRARIRKLLNCDLESGAGPVWVDFFDAAGGVPPPSAFYRTDGSQAGRTTAKGGDVIEIDGYSAIVPAKMEDAEGSFVINAPCQLWTMQPDGTKTYGRKVVAQWGPAPVPLPNTTVSDYVRLAPLRDPPGPKS